MPKLITLFAVIALLIVPLSLSSQSSFSLSLDVNSAAGDQAVTSVNVLPDELVVIQIFGREIQNANGISVRFEYDGGQVVYDGFDAGDVLPNAVVLPAEHGTNFVQISLGALGGQATVNTGLVGTIRFRTTAAFSGTNIRLVRGELGRGGQFERVTLNVRVSLQLGPVAPTPDFDSDGVVGFADFVQLVNVFGSRRGDGKYQAKYDLDSNGEIGFSDFVIFTNDFGTSAPASGGGGGGGGGSGDSAPKMYWTKEDAYDIQRANLDGSNVEDLVTIRPDYRGVKGIALDVAGGKMYWANLHDGKIQRANLDGSNIEDLVTGLRTPNGIALDLRRGKIYWTAAFAYKIQRADLDGSNVEDLVTGLPDPNRIALDVAGGKMYWTTSAGGDKVYKIQRANIDGSNVEDIPLAGFLNYPTGIALDVAGGKIYWTNEGTYKIQRADFDGSNVEDLVTRLGGLHLFKGPNSIALDVAGGKMYWTNRSTNKIQRANLDGSNVEDLVTGLRNLGGIALNISTAGSSGGGGAPGDDHSNNRSGATSLALGSSLSGRIETGGDVDYFRVQVNESGRLIVYTAGNLDTRGTLQNSSGSALTNNDDGGSENNFRIERSVNAGTYYIKVEGYDSSETGDYTLHARLINDGEDLSVYALYSGNLAVAFSPDGRYIATGDDQGDVGLWDLDSSRNVWWKRLGGEVVVVAFSPDGRYVAADGSDSDGAYVALLSVDSGTESQRTGVGATSDRATRVNAIAFSPNGNYVAIGVDLIWAWIWDLSGNRRNGWGTPGVSEVYAVAFSPNGRYLATGDDEGNANLWEVSSWWTDNADGRSMIPGGNVYAVAFSPDGRYLAADGYDGSNTNITIWEVIRERKVQELDAGNVFELAFRPDGRYLVAGDEDGIITFWRTDTWEIEKQIQTGGTITDLAWNPRGNLIADNKNIYEPLLSR